MKKFISTTFLFFAASIFTFAQEAEEVKIDETKAKKEITSAFNNYKKAILKQDSKLALAQLDKNSFDYYDQVLNIALRANQQQLDELEILDKLMVLSVKHRVPKEQLIKMNGRELLIYALDNGLIGKNTVEKAELGDIDIKGEIAYGQYIISEQKTPLYFGFTYDQSQWRLDITSIFEPAGYGIRKLVEMQNKDENEVIIMMIESTTPGQKVSQEIWKPIL